MPKSVKAAGAEQSTHCPGLSCSPKQQYLLPLARPQGAGQTFAEHQERGDDVLGSCAKSPPSGSVEVTACPIAHGFFILAPF